jgi:PIN domain nuclease of toxin-antitoxin system
MTVLDAYALIAFLLDEPAADEVGAELLKSDDARMSAVNLAEVVDHLIRVAGRAEDAVSRSLEWVVTDGLEVIPVDEPLAQLSGQLRARHYHHQRAAVSLADCVAVATSIDLDDSLATADPALAAVARKEGVSVLALPDTSGRRP